MSNGEDTAPNSFARRIFRSALRWSQPSLDGEQILDENAWRAQYDEISKTIWSLTSLLVGACLFCLVILGAPDASLVSADAKIAIPIASITVSYGDFLLLGPLFLIGLTLYLHVFIEQLLRLRLYKSSGSSSEFRPLPPFLFNLGRPSADVLSSFLFYALLPCVLAFFVWKAIPRPSAPWFLILAFIVVTAVMIGLGIRRFSASRTRPLRPPSRFGLGLLWALLGGCVVAFFPLAWIAGEICVEMMATPPNELAEQVTAPKSNFRSTALLRIRRLQLFAAALDKKNLNGFYAPYADLRKADFRETDLEGANLAHADLRKAVFTNANLAGADLSYAHLEGALLDNARLNAADLRNISIDELTKIDLKWRMTACIVNGDISRDCMGRPDLTWTDLSGANLRGGSLKGAQMTGVNLSYADLTGVDLTGTILRVADLRNALLPESIKDAVVEGALVSNRPGVPAIAKEAIVFLTNRASDACVQAPERPDNYSQPVMSYPCAQSKDRRYDWYVKRLPNSSFVFRTSAPGSEGHPACLDGTSGSYEGAPIQMWECNDDYENQHWYITPVADEYVLVEKENSGYCLDGTGTRDGSPNPYLLKCNHEDHNQHWRVSLPAALAPEQVTRSDNKERQKRAQNLEKIAHAYKVSPYGTELEYRGRFETRFYGRGGSSFINRRRSFSSRPGSGR